MKKNNKNKQNLITEWTYEYTLDSKMEKDLQSHEVLRWFKRIGIKASSMESGASEIPRVASFVVARVLRE